MNASSLPFQAEANLSKERPWMLSLGIACGFHIALLAGITHWSFQDAQYGIRMGANNLEIELTAAPAATVVTEFAEQPPPQSETEKSPVMSETAPPTLPDNEVAMEAQAPLSASASAAGHAVRSSQPLAKADTAGDGSSPIPGRDATTLRSEGGAQTAAKPDYLLNPAPPYPEAARQRGQAGVVRLLVNVDKNGKVASVQMSASSGYLLLDESALRTVRHWKFYPARLGSIPAATEVEVPIRFRLR